MKIRHLLTAVLCLGGALSANAQEIVQVPPPGGPQGMPQGMQPMEPPKEVVMPLKWVGGMWVAPFELINPADHMPPPPPAGPGGMGDGGFSGGLIGPSDNSEINRVDEIGPGQVIEGEATPPAIYFDYLIVDIEGDYVVSLSEEKFTTLNLTGAQPLLVASPYGFLIPVPVEVLQLNADDHSLMVTSLENSELLDGAKIVGSLGRHFLEAFQAELDQDARTLKLTRPDMPSRR